MDITDHVVLNLFQHPTCKVYTMQATVLCAETSDRHDF